MSSDRRLLSAVAREVPLDLVVVVAIVAAAWATLVAPLPTGNPLVVPLALLFVVIAPGYAIVTALFPARREAQTSDGHRLDVRGLDFPERLALGVGTSIVVVPFVAFALQATVSGVTRTPVIVFIGLLTLVATAAAILRWRALPRELRYEVRVSFPRHAPLADRVLVVVVAIAVVVAISSVGFATTTQRGGEDLTEFYVLAVQPDGTLLAEDYPNTISVGESHPLHIALDNHRGTATTYTVVALVQEVDLETGTVIRQEEFQRYVTTVDDGQSWGVTHDVAPVWTGVNIRIVYLLYIDEQPTTPSIATADQSVHLWMDVLDPLTDESAGTQSLGSTTVGDATPTSSTTETNGTANTTTTTSTTTNTTTNTSAAGAAATS